MPYQGRQPGVGVRNRFIYTATGGQTLFSGADSNGRTLAYQDGAYVDVYLNGVMLVPTTDFTATTKTSVSLTSGAAASDIVEIIAYDISSIADTVSKSQGGTFDGSITINGNLTATAGSFSGTLNTGNLAATGTAGVLGVTGVGGGIYVQAGQNTSTGSAAPLIFTNYGASSEWMRLTSTGSVGIGTSSPATKFSVTGGYISQVNAGVSTYLGEDGGGGSLVGTTSNHYFRFITNDTERMRIDSSGNVLVGTQSNTENARLNVQGGYVYLKETGGGDLYLRSGFGGNTDPAIQVASNDPLLFITSNSERMRIGINGDVGIGTSSPGAKLDVSGSFRTSDTTSLYGTASVRGINFGSAEVAWAQATTGCFLNFSDASGSNGGNYGLTIRGLASAGTAQAAMAFFTVDAVSSSFTGSLSKGSGSFKIDHPLKPETHHLVHSFVESPRADNIYRGKVALVDGSAVVNIDIVAGMTEGTFAALNRDIQCFTSNETGWCNVRGTVVGNILTIEAQDNTCTDTISWLVIGERQDQHMYDTDWTDENGKVIVEPLKEHSQP